MSIIAKLIAALVIVSLWAGIATWRWAGSGPRCDARIAEQRADDLEAAGKAQREALAEAAAAHAAERRDTRAAQTAAAGSTHTRETVIREVPVTGQCVMPAGIPSLAPAVKEARDAAAE